MLVANTGHVGLEDEFGHEIDGAQPWVAGGGGPGYSREPED